MNELEPLKREIPKDSNPQSYSHRELNPPIGHFLLSKLYELETKMQSRYGPNYSSIDALRSPDLLAEGMVWFGAYIVTFMPELAFIHMKALAQGTYELIRRTHKSKT